MGGAPAPKTTVKLGGKNFYYVMFDGTDTVDSAQFGIEMEKFGFRNLYTEMLKDNADPAREGRLIDPDHDWLPIWKSKPDGSMKKGVASKDGVAVVCPNGFTSLGNEDFWDDKNARLSQSTKFVRRVILSPGVYKRSDGKMALVAASTETPLQTAQLVQLSSHGWLGGFMSGNAGAHWMIIGGIAKKDTSLKFEGPVWLILAQCSTVCKATWPSWVTVFARSTPPVRGVLAYEEVAPAADTAARLAQQFFSKMKTTYTSGANKGKPYSFIDAWKWVNDQAGRHWAGIVHADAVDDSLSTFHEQTPIGVSGDILKPQDWTGKKPTGIYLGYSKTHDETILGQPISREDPPFKLKLEGANDSGAGRLEYDETNLDRASLVNKVFQNEGPKKGQTWAVHYEVTIEPPAGATADIAEATIEWVHIRLSKPKFKTDRIFKAPVVDAGVTAKYDFKGDQKNKRADEKSLYTFTVAKGTSMKSLVVKFHTVDSFAPVEAPEGYQLDDKLAPHHSYLWIEASLKLADGTVYKPFDFTTRGLLFYGGF